MQLQFQKTKISCLNPILRQVENLEQTQELRMTEGTPGATRILSAWGQILMRSKQWMGTTAELNGGVQVWVAYEPEDGTPVRCLDTWIPFQMHWDLPDGSPEGKIRILPRLRFVDARPVSAGKVMIRVGIAALGECLVPMDEEVSRGGNIPEDIELLESVWPVRIPRETGEKPFELDEMLTVPPSVPQPGRLLYWHMEPSVTDQKVMADKLVFRGSGNLHVFYRCEDGQFHSWDFEVPFHQYAQLEGSYSGDAGADVMMAMTRLDLDQDGEGKLHLHAGLTGQYLVDDRETLRTVEDAYSPCRELTVNREELMLPVMLDSRRENLYGEQQIPIDADQVADSLFLPDFPQIRREGDVVSMSQPGTMQLTYYDSQGSLQSIGHRWQADHSIRADDHVGLYAVPQGVESRITVGAEMVTVGVEVPVQIVTSAGQGIPMVTDMQLEERKTPDPNRPSLVLQRAGKKRLWDLARSCGSTTDAIRGANDLEGEPDPDKMLLIPVI